MKIFIGWLVAITTVSFAFTLALILFAIVALTSAEINTHMLYFVGGFSLLVGLASAAIITYYETIPRDY